MSQEEFFKTVTKILNELNIEYMLTGSIASSFYGEPRTTHDIDFVVIITYADITRILQKFDKKRYYIEEEEIKEAIINKNMFNLIDSITGFKADFWILGDDDYNRASFSRRVNYNILGVDTYIPTAEDVILIKLRWCKLSSGSEKQFKDASGVYEIQKESLDMAYIQKWCEKLEIQELLKNLIKESKM